MLTPRGVKIANPAFDVTPHELVTAIITENGVARAPYGKSLARLVKNVGSAPRGEEDALVRRRRRQSK